uniref:(California timema) hypothetical protein n=1 Tax=Timema californicum TaxID=61474 RepID=A0A7R9IXK8_TIMCA|nr:unnamed protein product [Timema californicum]
MVERERVVNHLEKNILSRPSRDGTMISLSFAVWSFARVMPQTLQPPKLLSPNIAQANTNRQLVWENILVVGANTSKRGRLGSWIGIVEFLVVGGFDFCPSGEIWALADCGHGLGYFSLDRLGLESVNKQTCTDNTHSAPSNAQGSKKTAGPVLGRRGGGCSSKCHNSKKGRSLESHENFINDPNWTPDENDTNLSMAEKSNNEINLPILCETESMEEAVRVERPETDVVLGEDKRGRHIPANKLSDAEVEKIKRHIEQFPVTEFLHC